MPKPFHISFLAEELQRRQSKNRRYSLRAFAAFIDTHPSALSRILAGKQEISIAIALQIIDKLKLDPDSQERFVFSVAQERYKHALATLSEGAQIDQLSSALRQSEERYRKLIDVVDQAVAIHEAIRDENGKVTDARTLRVNPVWEEAVGLKQEKAVGHALSELFPSSYSEILQVYGRAYHLQTVQRQELYSVEIDRYFDSLVVPLEGDRFMVTASDSTERRRFEERQSYLLGLNTLVRDLADPFEIQYRASCYLGEYLKCTNTCYAEYNHEQTRGTIYRDYVAPGAKSLSGSYNLLDFPVTMNTASREPLVIANTKTEETLSEKERAAFVSFSIGAVMAYLLIKDGKYVASLIATSSSARKWSVLDVELLKQTAELTWSAVRRAHAELALRRQSRSLEATLSSLADTMYALDKDRRFAYANRKFQEVIGLTRDQILGKTLEDLGYAVDSVERFHRQLDTVFDEGRIVHDENRETSPTGKSGIYDYILGPVRGDDGSVEMAVGISRETTERHALDTKLRQNEALLSLVFETLPIAIGIVDEKGEVVLSNREMRKYLPTGKIPSRDHEQTSRWKGIRPDGTHVLPNDFPGAKALRGDEYRDRLEMVFVWDDRSEARVFVTSRAVRDKNGSITGAFVVVEEP